jgi:selenium-binding protein 1
VRQILCPVVIGRNEELGLLENALGDVFYPDGVGAWAANFDADLDAGGLVADVRFFPNGDDFRGLRVHQTRLQGGDASSDSYCFVE